MSVRIKRRTLLSGLAAGTSAALFLPSLLRGQSASEVGKRRVLFIYAEGGWTNRHLMMRPPWAPPEWSAYDPYHPDFSLVPDDLEWEFDLTDPRLTEADFSRVLRPLYRHRDQMTVTEGLAMLSTAMDPYGDAHAKGHIACMSGTASAEVVDGVKSRASTPSLDQRIHELLHATDPDHQALAYRTLTADLFHEFVWRSDGNGGAVRVPVETSPAAAFARLLPNAGNAPADSLDLGRDLALSAAQRQFERLIPRLSGEDRVKLQSHRDMLADLQRRLGRTVDCAAPSAPEDSSALPRAERIVQDIGDFAQLIATAFACGMSRVASLGLVTIPPDAYGLPAAASIHHEYEHKSDPFHLHYQMNGMPTDEWAQAEEGMVQRNIWQAEQVARIIDVLRSVPEESGSLLDNTLVVYVSELSHGGHGHEHYPVILFGGFASAVTPGRYIKYAQNNPNPYNRNYHNEWTGTPHSHLLVSICQAFGMEIDYIGAPSLPGTVPHRNITGTVSLTGPLPRLAV